MKLEHNMEELTKTTLSEIGIGKGFWYDGSFYLNLGNISDQSDTDAFCINDDTTEPFNDDTLVVSVTATMTIGYDR